MDTHRDTHILAQNHRTAHDPVVAVPSHFPQTDGTQTACSVKPGVYQSRPISRVGRQSGETLWLCTIARSPTGPMAGSISYWRNKSGPQGVSMSWPARARYSTRGRVKPNILPCNRQSYILGGFDLLSTKELI